MALCPRVPGFHCEELFGLAAPNSSHGENPCPRCSYYAGIPTPRKALTDLAKKERSDLEQCTDFIECRFWTTCEPMI
jgi:hypothetical protein